MRHLEGWNTEQTHNCTQDDWQALVDEVLPNSTSYDGCTAVGQHAVEN